MFIEFRKLPSGNNIPYSSMEFHVLGKFSIFYK